MSTFEETELVRFKDVKNNKDKILELEDRLKSLDYQIGKKYMFPLFHIFSQ